MNNRTNLKIYALIFGIIAGTIIYNIFRIDFSFSMIKEIQIKDIRSSFMYILSDNTKFLIVILIISFFQRREVFILPIILYEAFVLSGMITTMILLNNHIFLYGVVSAMVKVIMALVVNDEKKNWKGRMVAIMCCFLGSVFQNFIMIYF